MQTPSPLLNIRCELCTFDDVLPIWRDQLWPGRASAIESCSAMTWLGGYDVTLLHAAPSFWRITQNSDNSKDATVGVLSGHFGGIIDASVIGLGCAIRSYRVRGIWVAPELRRRGFTRQMMGAAFEQAQREKCEALWIFPRQSSYAVYDKFGFTQASDWIGEGDSRAGEFGPNCYAIKSVNEHQSTSGD